MRIFLFLIVGFTLSILSSCKPAESEDGMLFRYNQVDGIETLDPAFAKSLSVMWAVNFMYNTLVEVDSSLDLVPSLAKDWEISEDGLQYTFHLRNDVYFHDNAAFPNGRGRKMVASDIAYSFERLINPQTASAGAWIFNGRVAELNPFSAPDDSTFIILLQQPFRPLIGLLSMQYCSVVPKEIVERWGKDFGRHPCGTGPFQFSFWDEGNILMFTKNPKYWEFDENRQRLPYLDGIKVSFNETRAIEFLKFRQKELDFMNGIDGSMQDLVLSKNGTLRPEFEKDMVLRKQNYLNTEYIGFQLNDTISGSPASNQKVRQAINYAIDREKIITYFRNGIGTPATRGFVPPSLLDSDVPDRYRYSPQTALQLLKEAGFPNGNGLKLLILSSPDANVDICNFISSQLNDIGIRTKVEVMQKSLLRQQMSRAALPFFKAQWIADYPDGETFLAVFYSKFPAPPNYTRFENATFDQLYELGIAENDDSVRHVYYQKMDSLVSDLAPVVPLYYDQLLHFLQKDIDGFRSNSLNLIDLKKVRKASR